MTRFAFLFVVAATAGCGRSSLPVDDDEPRGGDAGAGAQSLDAGLRPSIDAALVDSPFDAAVDAPREPSAKCTGPLKGWSEVDVRLGGDFQRLVAAASSEASGVWLAGGAGPDVKGVTELLRVEVLQRAPRIAEDIALAGTDGWEPLALAVAPERFALVARGPNGDAWLALFARDGTPLERITIDELQRDLGNNMAADVAWAGADIVVAAVRYGEPSDHFVVQRRDSALGARWSEAPWHEPPTTTLSFRFRPNGGVLRTRAALYDVTLAGLSKRPDDVIALGPIGAASSAWTGIDPNGFAQNGFVLEPDNAAIVRGPWPGHQWSGESIPVYESAAGIFITGNVELAPFIGWFSASTLTWIAIPRLGGGGIALGDANNVGAFFVGLEIPHPEQPLRYWGCTR